MNWIFDPDRLDGARVSDRLEYHGGRVLVLENDALRVVCLPNAGAQMVSFFNKAAGCECLIQPFDVPAFTHDPQKVRQSIAFSHLKPLCWPEMFPVASAYDDYSGQRQPFHGEANQLPWRYDILVDEPAQVAVRLQARMKLTPFVLTRVMKLDAHTPRLLLEEQVHNASGQKLPIIWGHHPTFGRPFLDEHCRIYLPPGEFIDGDESMMQIDPPNSGTGHMFYHTGYREGWYGLFNHQRGFGFGMAFDPAIFRVLWIWQSLNHHPAESPYFGRLYASALEPVSSLPAAHKRLNDLLMLTVDPGQTLATRLEAFLFHDPKDLGKR